MQAIFLHLVDEVFEPIGRKSLIQYLKLFSTYKQIIMTKLIAQEEDRACLVQRCIGLQLVQSQQ
jgi:hypothetical protein